MRLIIASFTFLYVFVPNTRVRLMPALIGGVFAGVLWAGSGSLFTSFVVSVSRYEAIYAGFAIVIVAMIWLYLSWLILLLGAQLAFYVQHPEYLRARPARAERVERDCASGSRYRRCCSSGATSRSPGTAGASRVSPRSCACRATCSSR